MTTLLNCSTVYFGDEDSVGILYSASNFETSNNSPEDSCQEVVRELQDTTPLQGMDLHLLIFDTESIDSKSGEPYLKIIQEPADQFSFRYNSEMGLRGSIHARSYERSRKKRYPSVQLCNYNGPATIRCSLYTTQANEKLRTPHCHRLIAPADNMEKDDLPERNVTQDNNYIAEFQGMSIVYTAKKNIVKELIKKKRERLLEKLQTTNKNVVSLSIIQESELRLEAEEEAKTINLNCVSLCFEAFVCQDDSLVKICEPIFSKPINNMNSAITGELRICRIDKSVGSCLGGEEVFILVERVQKRNIKVKFFEVNEDGSEKWHAYGKFSELDVHHQYAIVFHTPPYRDTQIEEAVDIFLQLYRPSDGCCSEPIPFRYKPSEKRGTTRKRSKISKESFLSEDQNTPLLNGHTNGTVNLETGLRNEADTLIEAGSDLISEFSDVEINFSEFESNNFRISEYIRIFDDIEDIDYDGEEIKDSSNLTIPLNSIDKLKTEKEARANIEKKDTMIDPIKTEHEQRSKAADFSLSATSKIMTISDHKVTLKELIRNDDDLHLRISDYDDNDVAADSSKYHTSMNLVKNNDEIPKKLMKVKKDMSSSLRESFDNDKSKEISLVSKKCSFEYFTLSETDSLKKTHQANYVPFFKYQKHGLNLADLLYFTFLVIHNKNPTSSLKLLF